MPARDRLFRFLTSGKFTQFNDESVMEEMVRYIIMNVVLVVGGLLLLTFGISVFWAGNVARSMFDFSIVILAAAALLLLRADVPFIVPSLITIGPFAVLCVILTLSGGDQGFAGLWIYALPPIAIFVLGLRIGSVMSLLVLAAVSAITFIPGAAGFDYSPAVAFRICGVFVLVLILTVVYEQIRLTKDRWVQKLTRDLKTERDEIAAMKDNLQDGLFLMDRGYTIQPQYSRSLETILDLKDLQGRNFISLLSASVGAKEQETLKDYFEMVFNRAFDQKMLEDINPLNELSYINVETREEKILACGFAPVDRGNAQVFILANIRDITGERELQRQLSEEESKRQEEMRSFFEIIQVEPRVFGDFIEDTEYEFDRINEILRDKSLSAKDAVIDIYQSVHAIKSNAIILGLESFSGKVHTLESQIKKMREQEGEITFEDLLHIALELEKIMTEKDKFRAAIDKIRSFKIGDAKKQDEYVLVESLTRASKRASEDQHKKVRFVVDGIDSAAVVYGPRRVMKEVLTQLVRNAVCHGIESPEERRARGKAETGTIRLSIKAENGKIHIKLRDDGKGLDFDRIREKAEELHLLRNSRDGEDKNFLLQTIFLPGFSTAETEGLHAGRGIGLNLVKDRIRDISGAIRLQTEPGKGTIFTIFIPLELPAAVNQAS
jgi:two-component system chemotaxis sensor kinase CheA